MLFRFLWQDIKQWFTVSPRHLTELRATPCYNTI
jgi:hypothetical protein